jgi:hypothetical protein
VEEFACWVLHPRNIDNEVSHRGTKFRGCEAKFFDFSCIDFTLSKILIIERSLTANQSVDVPLNLVIHNIRKERDCAHAGVEGPVSYSSTAHCLQGTFDFVADLAIDLNMNCFDGFVIGDAAGAVKLDSPPSEAHLDVVAGGLEQPLFNGLA